MSIKALLIILSIGIACTNASMQLNINSAKYSKSPDSWLVDIPVSGGTGNLNYNYESLPTGWSAQQNLLKIPTTLLQQGGQYPIKSTITDAKGNELQRTILVQVSLNGISLGEYSYGSNFNYDFSNYTPSSSSSTSSSSTGGQGLGSTVTNYFGLTGTGAGTGSGSSSGSGSGSSLTSVFGTGSGSGSTSGFGTGSFGTGSGSSSGSSSSGSSSGSSGFGTGGFGTATGSTSGNSLTTNYVYLPSTTELDTIISSSDVVAITKTIQTVIESGASCSQKVAYLQNFLGRLQSFIQLKTLTARNLKAIVDAANEAIRNLNAQISALLAQIDQLGVPALRVQLEVIIAKLNSAYDVYNGANVDTLPLSTKINSLKSETNNLQTEVNKAKNQITNDTANVGRLDGIITDFENKLKLAREERGNYVNRIKQSEDFINQANIRFGEINNEINSLNTKIQDITNQKNGLQQGYKGVENDVDKIRSAIAAAVQKEADLLSRISAFRVEINNNEIKVDPKAFNDILAMVKTLQDAIPGIQAKIDALQFSCNGVVNPGPTGPTTVWKFTPGVFTTYFTNTFGLPSNNNILSGSTSASQPIIVINTINIFSPAWVTAFGQPFATDIRNLGSNFGTGLGIGAFPGSGSGFPGSGSGFPGSGSGFPGSGSGFPGSGSGSGFPGSGSGSGFPGSSGTGLFPGTSGSGSTGSGSGSLYSFPSDTSCSGSGSGSSSSSSAGGSISGIKGNTITVKGTDGRSYTLQLGSCSMLQAITGNLPQVGNNIYWKGWSSGSNVNVQNALCY